MKHIYRKFQAEILKRSFEVKNEGMCVRLSVVEDVLRRALEEQAKINEFKATDWWAQPIQHS